LPRSGRELFCKGRFALTEAVAATWSTSHGHASGNTDQRQHRKIFEALTEAEVFSQWTGAPARISPDEGGAFSCFDGAIVGRDIERVPHTRIVQAWRVASMWAEGAYSIARFDLAPEGDATTLTLIHTGYPEEAASHLEGGWHKRYWEPLKALLESGS
jgi:activator of HSP90 ATPase